MKPFLQGWLALALALSLAPRAEALIPGGGPAASDCYAEWQVTSPSATGSGQRLDCEDGDPACDADTVSGQCTFNVSVCVLQTDVPGCNPSGVQVLPPIRFKGKTRRYGLQAPADLTTAGCGPAAPVVARLRTVKRGRNKGKQLPSKPIKLTLSARTTGSPRVDNDSLTLVCVPPQAPCPANPSGPTEPNEIRFVVPAGGTDLDNGWKGTSHNFLTPAGTRFQLCLSNCDRTSDPICDARAITGPNTFNRTTFGPPLPLAEPVPVCVRNDFDPLEGEQTGGTANIQTGEVTGPLKLKSHVFINADLCPRCEGGRCTAGPNEGGACRVDGSVFVKAKNLTYNLSKDCPPSGAFVGALDINLPLTTGTSTLQPLPGGSAATPCVAQPGEPQGIAVEADPCPGGGRCAKDVCTGPACASKGRDFVTGEEVCLDSKGGISRHCCDNFPSVPCHPTSAPSGGVLSRSGKAVVPQPPWPDPTYPKTTPCEAGNCFVQGAAFCEAATTDTSLNIVVGLPGPGALILPAATQWLAPR
jgi:hypothetical protein